MMDLDVSIMEREESRITSSLFFFFLIIVRDQKFCLRFFGLEA